MGLVVEVEAGKKRYIYCTHHEHGACIECLMVPGVPVLLDLIAPVADVPPRPKQKDRWRTIQATAKEKQLTLSEAARIVDGE